MQSKSGDPSASQKLSLSCAECRRSKLKCDRSFPCQSCMRRGCAHLCPEGTLKAVKGNKVLMAHAQRLTEQVKTLKSRVQELEQTLAKNHDPKNSPTLSNSVPSDGDATDVSDAIESRSISSYGHSYTGDESAGKEEYLPDLSTPPDPEVESSTSEPQSGDGSRAEIFKLVNAFPLGVVNSKHSKNIFREHLPTKERAVEIVGLYYSHASWMFDIVVSPEFASTIMNPIYESDFPSLEQLHPHQISVFFGVLANGSLADVHTDLSRKYHSLARAALSMVPIAVDSDCATVQALFLIVRFLYSSDRSAMEERWLLTGITARIVQKIDLHHEASNWDPPEEAQRRRRIFWNLFCWEVWGGLIFGRPPTLAVYQVDCQYPEEHVPYISPGGEKEMSWNTWKYEYSAVVGTAAADNAFGSRNPQYSSLLDIDKKVRDFPIPEHLQAPLQDLNQPRSWAQDPILAMQQYCILSVKSSNLIYVHRCSYAQAIHQMPKNPLQHPYATSVMTVYECARRIISGLHGVYAVDASMAGYIWYFWSSMFSACVVLGALVVQCPGCSLAPDALCEIQTSLALYRRGTRLFSSQNSVEALSQLCARATASYAAFQETKITDHVNSRATRVLANPGNIQVAQTSTNLRHSTSPDSDSPGLSTPAPDIVSSTLSPPTLDLTANYQPLYNDQAPSIFDLNNINLDDFRMVDSQFGAFLNPDLGSPMKESDDNSPLSHFGEANRNYMDMPFGDFSAQAPTSQMPLPPTPLPSYPDRTSRPVREHLLPGTNIWQSSAERTQSTQALPQPRINTSASIHNSGRRNPHDFRYTEGSHQPDIFRSYMQDYGSK